MADFSRIVTHSGPFHADDVLAVSVLLDIAPDAKVIRTRDREILQNALIDPQCVVVDVGWSWDRALRNFDHHQKDFSHIRANKVPFASIGLVWEQFGEAWLEKKLGDISPALRGATKCLIDEDFIQSVDAFDCGVVSGALRVRGESAELRVPSVADIIGSLNPTWEEKPDFDSAFMQAVQLGQRILVRQAVRALSEVRYQDQVLASDDGSELLVLSTSGPWRRHVLPHHLVVVFPAVGEDGWLAQAVGNPESTVFPPALRITFPEAWRGRAESELREMTGVVDATFCHRAGFIAGALSREGAIALAKRLLSLPR